MATSLCPKGVLSGVVGSSAKVLQASSLCVANVLQTMILPKTTDTCRSLMIHTMYLARLQRHMSYLAFQFMRKKVRHTVNTLGK